MAFSSRSSALCTSRRQRSSRSSRSARGGVPSAASRQRDRTYGPAAFLKDIWISCKSGGGGGTARNRTCGTRNKVARKGTFPAAGFENSAGTSGNGPDAAGETEWVRHDSGRRPEGRL